MINIKVVINKNKNISLRGRLIDRSCLEEHQESCLASQNYPQRKFGHGMSCHICAARFVPLARHAKSALVVNVLTIWRTRSQQQNRCVKKKNVGTVWTGITQLLVKLSKKLKVCVKAQERNKKSSILNVALYTHSILCGRLNGLGTE